MHDIVSRAVSRELYERAQQQGVPPDTFAKMHWDVGTDWEVSTQRLRLRVQWCEPGYNYNRRCMDMSYDTAIADDLGLMALEVKKVVANLDVRGELFFFKIAKHFPKHLGRVTCNGDGFLTIVFKNGHQITGREDEVDSSEFIARCGMIYDL